MSTVASSAVMVVSTMFGSGLVSTTWGTSYGLPPDVALAFSTDRTATTAVSTSTVASAATRPDRPLPTTSIAPPPLRRRLAPSRWPLYRSASAQGATSDEQRAPHGDPRTDQD